MKATQERVEALARIHQNEEAKRAAMRQKFQMNSSTNGSSRSIMEEKSHLSTITTSNVDQNKLDSRRPDAMFEARRKAEEAKILRDAEEAKAKAAMEVKLKAEKDAKVFQDAQEAKKRAEATTEAMRKAEEGKSKATADTKRAQEAILEQQRKEFEVRFNFI